MKKLKIVIMGPLKCGKSTIANFLSEAIDYNIDNYRPTPGLRILEYEIKNNRTNTEIELWDCSGDEKYECYWPVFSWKTHAVVLVYNPEENSQLTDLEHLYENFVAKNLFSNNNVLIIANCKETNKKDPPDSELNGPLASITHVNTNVMENNEDLRNAFENFVSNIEMNVKDYDLDELGFLFN